MTSTFFPASDDNAWYIPPVSPLALDEDETKVEISHFMEPKREVYNFLTESKNELLAQVNRKKFQLSERENRIQREGENGHNFLTMTSEQYFAITKLYREIGALSQELQDLEKILLKYEVDEFRQSLRRSMFLPITPPSPTPEPVPESPS
jgi:hypothetical protein